jgi:sulfur transfer protein SufE/stress-induced morphogen
MRIVTSSQRSSLTETGTIQIRWNIGSRVEVTTMMVQRRVFQLVAHAILLGILCFSPQSNCFLMQSSSLRYCHQPIRHFAEPTGAVETLIDPSSEGENTNPLGLTPELQRMVTAFERIGDDKLRYKQLLYMAGQLAPIDPSSQIPENKVPGCLSTVYVDGSAELSEGTGEYLIQFVGDSDGLLTKGLVALLVRGLSGNSATAIQRVDPTFIQQAGISTSLTPGRNNGFLNMLAVMKRKALELEAGAKSSKTLPETANSEDSATSPDSIDRPMYTAMVTALQTLQPQTLELKDVSYQHAGHAQAGDGVESHFELYVVADAFEGLNLIKRHKLVYMMLGDIMPKIHALNIVAKTPTEVQ